MALPEIEHDERQKPRDEKSRESIVQLVPDPPRHMGEIAMAELVGMKREHRARMDEWAKYRAKTHDQREADIASRPLNLTDATGRSVRRDNDADR